MYYNTLHESLGKPLIKNIRVMQNIGFTTSPNSTTSTPENLGETIDQMTHWLPTICL